MFADNIGLMQGSRIKSSSPKPLRVVDDGAENRFGEVTASHMWGTRSVCDLTADEVRVESRTLSTENYQQGRQSMILNRKKSAKVALRKSRLRGWENKIVDVEIAGVMELKSEYHRDRLLDESVNVISSMKRKMKLDDKEKRIVCQVPIALHLHAAQFEISFRDGDQCTIMVIRLLKPHKIPAYEAFEQFHLTYVHRMNSLHPDMLTPLI